MSKLLGNWKVVSLADISEIQMGQSPDSSTYNDKRDGLPFFQGKAEFGKLNPTVRKWCSDPKKIAEKGDILLSIRAPVGPSNVAIEKCSIGRGLASLRAIDPLNQSYLFHFIRNLEPWLSLQGTGTTFAAVSGDFIRTIEIPIAPLSEQKRIADKLDIVLARLDVCRERLNRIPLILKRFKQSVLAAATSGKLTDEWRATNVEKSLKPTLKKIDDFAEVTFELPDGWEWDLLVSAIHAANYGTSSKSSERGKMPVLRMGNLQNGKLDWNNLVYSENEQDNLKYFLEYGDVLFNRTNSPELVGKTSIYLGEQPAIFAGYLIRVKCNEQKLLPKYLNICLNSPFGRAYCWAVKSDGVSQSNINAEKLRNLPIPFCTVEEQQEIVRRVETLFAFADCLETRLTKARNVTERLMPALLAKAFRGELVEQDPKDESAEILLKRIQSVTPIKEKKASSPRNIMAKLSAESVKAVIHQMQKKRFNFEELRTLLPGDYDSMKDILFLLMSEATPLVRQVFDEETKKIIFEKV